MTTLVSVREVLDVTYRVFRAAGFSSGCAMRAAAMVQHAEVYHGIGLRMLHRQLGPITDGTKPSGFEVSYGPEGVLFLDAAGDTALVAGPPAMDLACAEATTRGAGVLWLRNVHELSLLEELAYRVAASEEFVCALSWTSAEPGREPLGLGRTVIAGPGSGGPIGVERALPGPSALALSASGLLEEGPIAEGAGKLVGGLLSAGGGENARKLVEQSLSVTDTGKNASPNGAVLVCVRVPDAPESRFEPLLRRVVEWAGYRDARLRTQASLDRIWEEVCASGVELDDEPWSELYGAAGRMLVPEPDNSAW